MGPDVHNDGAGPQLQGSERYFLFLVFESAVGGEYLEAFRLKHWINVEYLTPQVRRRSPRPARFSGRAISGSRRPHFLRRRNAGG